MTRKQAEKVADTVVALARAEAVKNGIAATWTELHLTVPADLLAKVNDNPALVNGCLPLGWWLSGNLTDSDLTVCRRA